MKLLFCSKDLKLKTKRKYYHLMDGELFAVLEWLTIKYQSRYRYIQYHVYHVPVFTLQPDTIVIVQE